MSVNPTFFGASASVMLVASVTEKFVSRIPLTKTVIVAGSNAALAVNILLLPFTLPVSRPLTYCPLVPAPPRGVFLLLFYFLFFCKSLYLH